MRKTYKFLIFLLLTLFFPLFINAQTFDGDWSAEYVTSDNADSTNSTGYNTISVTTLAEDSFVALVNRGNRNSHYLVGYRNAGKNSGRLGTYPYAQSDFRMKWIHLFDQEYLYDANDLTSMGNLIFVPNNDTISNSILMFEVKEDSIYTFPKRFKLNTYVWGIDIDQNGRLYVTKFGDDNTPGSVMVIESYDKAPAWTSNGASGTILTEFTLPEVGEPRGITVNPEGTIIYVSNFDQNKVYCYVGNPTDGYSLYDGFNFSVDNEFFAAEANDTLSVGPFGLQLMPEKNLLFITHDANFRTGAGYEYGRVYIANPNTGEVLDTINIAEWCYSVHNSYTDRTTGIASGFTSVYNVDLDENFNAYTQSYYGWTVDKWIYSSELPTIEIVLTDVKKVDETIPNKISLEQNYPNPFNPTTTINFSLNNSQNVTLNVYDVTGQLVTNLINSAHFNSGTYKITFDASKLSSGTYFYSLKAGEFQATKKMTLIK